MDKKISYNALLAFSLVELMISLITISLIAAAFAPVITKKLSHGTITVGSFGGSGIIETSTAPQSQKDCNTVGAQLVYVETNETQHTGICVTQYNIGDGNFSIPTGSIDENIEAGISKPDGYCNTKKCCWHGATSGTSCDSVNGSYSGCNRTVCNWEAANSICDNLSYGGYSNWRLPTKDELEKMNPDTYSKIGSEHAGDGGLMFCGNYADYNSSRCSGFDNCSGSYQGRCYPDSIYSSEKDGSDENKIKRYALNSGNWGFGAYQYTSSYSTRCVLGAITVKTVSDTACSNGSFLNDDSACVSCTIHSPKCTSCTKDFCSACADGWKVSASGGCEDPNKKSCTITFGEAGDKQFTIPSDVDSMEVTLVSGGNGGNGGSGTVMTHTFSTITAVSTPTETNLATVLSTGIIDWTIPQEVKSKNVLINACGGGGGGGGRSNGGNGSSQGSNGGRGGYVLNQILKTPNQTSLKINIGGGGGHGAVDDTNNCGAGGYSYAGGGGVSNGGTGCRPLNFASETYGQGGVSNGSFNTGSPGGVGYSYGYSFSSLGITTYGKGGADGGAGARGGSGGSGGVVGGGGGGGAPGGSGAGGGSATLFLEENLIVNPNYVASGGGGGAGGGYNRDATSSGGGGGAGGGINGGNGGHGGYTLANHYLTNGSNGADIGSAIPPFNTTNFCAGGVKGSNATDGKPGIMIIKYIGTGATSTGGSGGGSGAIVPLQSVDLSTNDHISAGEVLKIHVGAGGAGGAGAHIADDGTITTSGGAGSQGEETYISNNSNVKILATKGMQSGSSAGYITNGKNTTQITVENFSSSNGSANNAKAGGNGGTIILNGEEFIGGAGATSAANGEAAPAGNYGAGGGGGYGAMAGGNGADGYAKIKFMTSSANCTTAKAEIAYNDFIENKNNIFMKIKLALIQFKDFIVALFNPTIKCKTCMK